MSIPAVGASSSPAERASNLWKQAYQDLSEDEERSPKLEKLKALLKHDLGKPHIKLRSDDGVRDLLSMMEEKKRTVQSKKSTEKIQSACSHMMKIQDIVGAGASVGGPYVAIPVAALFSVFAMNEIYFTEKAAAFSVAETVSDYIVMFPDDGYSTTITTNDSSAMRAVKEKLRSTYVALYKAIIFATAQLALSSNSDFKWLKGVAKHYDWESQLADLHKQKQRIFDFEATKKKQEEKERAGNVKPLQPDLNLLMGPAERNPLHWAAALGDSQQVTFFVQSKEYPINALTMKSWTAAHLAAREGHTKILITLMTAPGIDLFVTNREGRTPLHIAVIYKQRSAARVLLERNPGLLKPRDQWKRTAFLIAAEKGHVEILKVLKQYGQDMNEMTVNQGWTALHLAAENGHVDTVKWLAENGTKKWTKVRDGPGKGLTAKKIAEQRGKIRVLEFL